MTLKALILAAGQKPLSSGTGALELQPLGDTTVLGHVIRNLKGLVAPRDVIVVSAPGTLKAVQMEVGWEPALVIQDTPLGTGHAVLQAADALAGFDGDLLILYGDTPLLRPASLRGLLNRHRLKSVSLTLLTANVPQDLPYGRVRRDEHGKILDIVEQTEADDETKAIRELNVGAYIVKAATILDALKRVAAKGGEIRLTDCVKQLLHSGLKVDSYQLYDVDEVRGINDAGDLEAAAFILQKRLFRPHRQEEENEVAFGTGGWRAIIGEGFTMHNVRRLSQALANEITRKGLEKKGVIVGYDRRFLSRQAAEAASEVFAGNNIPTILCNEDAPTPLINYATAMLGSGFGLAFTASHNPPEWNGLKVFHGDGSLLLDDETRVIAAETNALTTADVIKLELDLAIEAGIVAVKDFTNQYIDAVEALIDMDAIRKAGLRLAIDPMYGVGQLTLETLLTEGRCRCHFIHNRHNPLFGGRSPAPDPDAMRDLINMMQQDHYDLGLAMDGDADRIALLDDRGRYISFNDVLVLLYWYLHEVRGQTGGVVRNLSTTHLLERLAKAFGEKCTETPVGFKHIAAGMVADNALLGGESSGGLTIRGHILGKDGIFASGIVVEMVARTKAKISELQEKVWAITGRLYSAEENFPATPEMKIAIPQRLKKDPCTTVAGYAVERISHVDGTKLYLENDNWAQLRFSGTEPVLRLAAEADSPEKAAELIAWLKQFASA
ncbi:NTP transferase domain-containing protein [Rhizomicrobium electricum]|uniref:Phosphomannomutase n=1 Tax=Rhizomicrobium electricum TaxID=480070 RepID=A0ABP3PSX8_9PROT|nr:NTP transferase domain-containing protein [Rhizomicrobium electricum]NIJ49630.1 phosphomannomutase [Rhizomicrobium electricum]